MKKILSVLLAVLVLASCLGVLPALAAEDDTSTTKPISESLNEMVSIDFTNALNNPSLSTYENLLNAQSDVEFEQAMLNGVNFMGLDLNYLYNSKGPIVWGNISVSRNDLALVLGNLNAYLLKMKKEKLNNYRFYTNEHAMRICNFIGHLYDPEFTDIKISFDNNPTTSDVFYNTICERSGLSEWIKQQWIQRPDSYYVELCTSLGMRLNNLVAPQRDINDAYKVAPLLVKSIVEYQAMGPFSHLIELIRTFALTYDVYLSKSIVPFFEKYWGAESVGKPYHYDKNELYTFKGLLNAMFNGNKKGALNSAGVPKMQFITPPVYRMAKTTDDVEQFLYLIVYCNLLGVYSTNAQTVKYMKTYINNSSEYSATEKERLVSIIGMLFEGKFAEAEPALADISQEIITDIPTNLKDMLFGFFGRFLDAFYGFFDKIYQAIRKFL